MTMLVTSALVFLAIHLLVAGTPVRDMLTGAIGEGPYLGLFSLASLGVIVWLAMSYGAAHVSAENHFLFNLGRGVHDLAIPVVLIAFLIGVPGLLTPNPTSVGQSATAAKEETVRGILRVTRHPFLWSVAIWSAFHLGANGDVASVIFFGTFLALSVLGTFSIDAKRKRKMGDAWNAFAGRTSNIPFGAIVSGRNSLRLGEYLDWRFLTAVAIFAAVLFAHARIFGASPFPGGWVPF
jgi:uncharacterized membrane protein